MGFSPNPIASVSSNQGTPAAASSAWPVKHTDGTNFLPAADAAARALFAKVTDGTNTAPTADAVTRALFAKVTDGTNTLPSGDAIARSIFTRLTDGTTSVGVVASNNALKVDQPSGSRWSCVPYDSNGTELTNDADPGVAAVGVVVRPVDKAATSTTSLVADSATEQNLLAANTSRKMATVANDSSARLYVKLGDGATTTDYTVSLAQHEYYELPHPVYTGIISGIWASDPGDGAARITELT